MTSQLYDIDAKAFAGEKLSPEELEFATRLASGVDLEDAILANGVLFLAGNQLQKRSAVAQLQALCEMQSLEQNRTAAALILRILEYLPARQLRENAILRDFTYAAVKSDHFAVRGNAVRVLRRLAEIDDTVAIGLLNEALTDAHPSVRRGAEIALNVVSQRKTGDYER